MLLDAVMHVGHEGVEVHPTLAAHRHRFEEQIHQHGLAAADTAVDVKAGYLLGGRPVFGEQPAERARLALQTLRPDLIVQAVKRNDDRALRRIVGDLAGLDEMRIALRDGRMRLKAVTQMHRSQGKVDGGVYLESEIGNPVEVCPSNFSGPDE